MILHINAKLNVWADWVAAGRKVVGLGYPSHVSFLRLPSSNSMLGPIENEEAWEIEKAVHRLDVCQRDVIEQFYLRVGTADSHAKALRICRDTLYVRLHAAHVRIMEWLQVGDEVEEEKNRLTHSDTFDTKRVR